ncbi:hypothetical protein EJV47_16125 [Hymenobacter gummosus]|uniref:Uncharacterized protein n=1 Tax=Hymenobacter gummosus TaxID=1776032 RepID=A0A431U0P6_9BACT|nr:hypothetical protein [Hymenobacter gummosus]RTQ48497.1 hypothetical protein EJV47_16125 [Hymenobacter gummosus]
MKPLCLFPLPLLLLAAGCKKEPKTEVEKLPRATQEGKNTAGFLLDGRAWLPSASDLTASGPVGARREGRSLTVYMVRNGSSSERVTVNLFLPEIFIAGAFLLNRTPNISLGYRPAHGLFSQYAAFPNGYYFTGPDAVGELVVTRFDTVARVVSGTFEMRVREPNTGQTRQLTQGRFDARF